MRHVAPLLRDMELRDNAALTFRGPDEIVRRTWRERLFALPWKPWQTTRVAVTVVPDPQFYVLDNSVIVAHPETMRSLRESLAELE